MSSRFGALDAAPSIAAARAALEQGGRAWIVGGAIRDALLAKQVADADLAVEPGSEQSAARAIARVAGGSAFPLSEKHATWRAVAPTDGWHVDVAALRAGTIEDDLRARDFTVNAIAIPLAGGEPIDPTGGVSDSEARLLRAASEGAFRRRPDPAASRRAALRRARSLDRAGDGRARPLRRDPGRRTSRRAAVRGTSRHRRRAGPAARDRADGRARPHAGGPARAGGAPGRRPEPEPPPRRPRPHAGGARGVARARGATWRAFAGEQAAETRALPRRAARRRAHPAGRAALRRALPRPRQAGDPLGGIAAT